MFPRSRMTDSPAPTQEAKPPGEATRLDFGPLGERLGYALRRAQIAVFRDFFDTFAPFDIKPAQYSILTIIERNPGLRQAQVCDALGIKRTNFVAMIDELEARGLVRRDESPGDRRSYALVLTEGGETLMPKLHATSETHERRLITALGARRYEEMTRAMVDLARKLEGAGEEG
jgi:DNA-binding MarR family transcriptional regulator